MDLVFMVYASIQLTHASFETIYMNSVIPYTLKSNSIILPIMVALGRGDTYGEDGNKNNNITVKIGQEFTIALASNPTTGYQWNPEFNTNNIKLVSHSFTPSSKLMGASGKDIFTFKAIEKGSTPLRMLYGRSWEKEFAKEEVYLVHIV